MTDALDNLHLLQPLWLLTLPPLLWWLRRHGHRLHWPALLPPARLSFPPLVRLDGDAATQPQSAPSLSRWLLGTALTLLIVALAQPAVETATVEGERRAEPVDLVLLVGTAVTMNLRDYLADGERVSRMTMLKTLLADFVQRWSGRRIALVVLGDPPAVWLPLTRDRDAVLDAIGRLRTGLGGRLSDTGGALTLIAERFAGDDKVVVLLTDAGLQLGSIAPEQGAQTLAASGLTLHTIAVGSADPAAAEENAAGLIHSPVDLTLMQRLAEIGHGQSFRALDTEHMRQALATIEALHRRPAPPPARYALLRPLYPWCIGAAMLLLLASLFTARFERRATP